MPRIFIRPAKERGLIESAIKREVMQIAATAFPSWCYDEGEGEIVIMCCALTPQIAALLADLTQPAARREAQGA